MRGPPETIQSEVISPTVRQVKVWQGNVNGGESPVSVVPTID